MAFFEIKQLRKKFGGSVVLDGVDLTLEKGNVLGIIGISGGGKTTLLRCINGLETPDSGDVLLDGKPVIRDGRSIGMVFQSFNLFPHLTVKKNLTLAARLMYNKTVRKKTREQKRASYAEIDVRAKALAERMGLKDKLGAYPYSLSGGQCQRVAIARALRLDPEVLCFDEPTSALDPELTLEVLKVIASLKKQGVTMLIVTHEIEFAREVADTVIFLDKGVVLEHGDAKELIDNPKTERAREFLNKIVSSGTDTDVVTE